MSGRFLVCGEAVIDLFQDPAAGALAFSGQPAGSPYNVAVGLARLGCGASFVTGLSRDAFGEKLIAALAKEGVDWSLAPRTDRPTILSFVLVGADGQPSYAFYGENGADLQVRASDWPAAVPADIDAIHLGGFPLAQKPSKRAYLDLIEREAGQRFISLDPNVRPQLMGDMKAFRAHFARMAARADLIKASTEDMAHLYPGERPDSIARTWLKRGAALVVVTDGPNGATAYVGDHQAHAGVEPVKVVDTVGAGDSFMSALLAGLRWDGLLRRAALREIAPERLRPILAYANKAAGVACGRRGANPPTRTEIAAAP